MQEQRATFAEIRDAFAGIPTNKPAFRPLDDPGLVRENHRDRCDDEIARTCFASAAMPGWQR